MHLLTCSVSRFVSLKSITHYQNDFYYHQNFANHFFFNKLSVAFWGPHPSLPLGVHSFARDSVFLTSLLPFSEFRLPVVSIEKPKWQVFLLHSVYKSPLICFQSYFLDLKCISIKRPLLLYPYFD